MYECTKRLFYQKTINPFPANVLILYPLKTPEKQRFSGGIKWEHWPEMS